MARKTHEQKEEERAQARASHIASARETWLPMAMSVLDRAVKVNFKIIPAGTDMHIQGRNKYGETVAYELPMDHTTLSDDELHTFVTGHLEDIVWTIQLIEEQIAEEERKAALVRSARSKLTQEELLELSNSLKQHMQ